jgi:hypothetical protein
MQQRSISSKKIRSIVSLSAIAQRRYAESADMFEQARSILVAAYGASHARVVKLDQMLVALYEEWGRPLPRR